MCQKVQYSYLCGHKTPYHLRTCAFLSTPNHYRAVTTIPQKWFCHACSNRHCISAIPVAYAPAPVILTPALNLPRISPGPGSHGALLPIPPNTPTEVRWETVRGRSQPIIHYHSSPATNAAYNRANRHGYNTLHDYDPGSLPPGWGSGTNPFTARGYTTLHGYDPGNPPPGWGGAVPVPVQPPFPIHVPATIPSLFALTAPAPAASVSPQTEVNAVHSASPVATAIGANTTGNNNEGAAGAIRPPHNSSALATHGSISSSETLTERSNATSISGSNSREALSTGLNINSSDDRS